MTKMTRKATNAVRPAKVAGGAIRAPRPDCREFLYRATGEDTDPRRPLELADNVAAELRRLDALAHLIGSASEGVDRARCAGVAEILQDGVDRVRRMLELSGDRRR